MLTRAAIQIARLEGPSSFTLAHYRRSSSFPSQHPANQGIVDFLLKNKEEEDKKPKPNWFRLHAYNSAILTVSRWEAPIRTGEDLHAVPGIGLKLTQKINDYLFKQYAQNEATDEGMLQAIAKSKAKALFQTIPGVGPAKAEELAEAGCHSIGDLVSDPTYYALLTPAQVLHAKYLKNSDLSVSRSDAENVLQFFKDNLSSGFEMELVGDYRRGLDTFPSVHILISHPDYTHTPVPSTRPQDPNIKSKIGRPPSRILSNHTDSVAETFLQTDIISSLQGRHLISDALESSPTSWKGYILLPNEDSASDRARAIETKEGQFTTLILQLVPKKTTASSLAFYTGDGTFNRYLRIVAEQQRMLFNEHGVWHWVPDSSQKSPEDSTITTTNSDADAGPASVPTSSTESASQTQTTEDGHWVLQPAETEEDVFKLLNIKYIEPVDRIGPGNWHIPGQTPKRRFKQHPAQGDAEAQAAPESAPGSEGVPSAVHDEIPTSNTS